MSVVRGNWRARHPTPASAVSLAHRVSSGPPPREATSADQIGPAGLRGWIRGAGSPVDGPATLRLTRAETVHECRTPPYPVLPRTRYCRAPGTAAPAGGIA